MFRYFIRLSFNGTHYHGWQMQKNAITVQQVLTETLSVLFGKQIELTGCGRTDTGVHAEEFFAHFDSENELSDEFLINICRKLNVFLPFDIVIHEIFAVVPDAHARFSAIARTYEYRISKIKNPFLKEFSYYYHHNTDIEIMNLGGKILMEFKDFSCFSRSHTQTKTNNCLISEAKWMEFENALVFSITADRFLRNMVRAIVGTMIEMGRGKINEERLREIVLSKNRSMAGKSAPAHGLFLKNVNYPHSIIKSR